MSENIVKNKDLGPFPVIVDIDKETMENRNFRTVIWTGNHMQITVMSIPKGGDIGKEMHDNVDQFIRVESGCANVFMGKTQNSLKFVGRVNSNYAIVIPAGTWHNVVNASDCPLKVYSIYAPPQHPFGTVHETKIDSDIAEH